MYLADIHESERGKNRIFRGGPHRHVCPTIGCIWRLRSDYMSNLAAIVDLTVVWTAYEHQVGSYNGFSWMMETIAIHVDGGKMVCYSTVSRVGDRHLGYRIARSSFFPIIAARNSSVTDLLAFVLVCCHKLAVQVERSIENWPKHRFTMAACLHAPFCNHCAWNLQLIVMKVSKSVKGNKNW